MFAALMYQRVKSISEFKKQIIKFGLIGFLAVFVDLGIYYTLINLLVHVLPDEIYRNAVSKSVSFMCGTFVTYNLNKFWTWRKRDQSNKRFVKFMLLYGVSMLVNVSVNSFLIFFLPICKVPDEHIIMLSFIGATGMSAVMNFTGQKIWVFRNKLES